MARPDARPLILFSTERNRIGHVLPAAPPGLFVGRSSSADFEIRDEALSWRRVRSARVLVARAEEARLEA